MRRTALVAIALLVSTTALGVLPSQAAAPPVLAQWDMNEPAGATTMIDSSGNEHHGDVGDEVVTGVTVPPEGLAYTFERLQPNTPPARPEHNVLVPHDDGLNPAGRAEYVVEVRLRTRNKFGNVAQKGQAGAKGGYWKIQLPQAEPSCLFRGPTGITNAVRAKGRPINDNVWHTIRCEATPTEVRMYLDGEFIGRNRGTTGRIANQQNLAIGGKYFCDQVQITCDYFGGEIDYVRLEGTS